MINKNKLFRLILILIIALIVINYGLNFVNTHFFTAPFQVVLNENVNLQVSTFPKITTQTSQVVSAAFLQALPSSVNSNDLISYSQANESDDDLSLNVPYAAEKSYSSEYSDWDLDDPVQFAAYCAANDIVPSSEGDGVDPQDMIESYKGYDDYQQALATDFLIQHSLDSFFSFSHLIYGADDCKIYFNYALNDYSLIYESQSPLVITTNRNGQIGSTALTNTFNYGSLSSEDWSIIPLSEVVTKINRNQLKPTFFNYAPATDQILNITNVSLNYLFYNDAFIPFYFFQIQGSQNLENVDSYYPFQFAVPAVAL